jgi:hypothetical protein
LISALNQLKIGKPYLIEELAADIFRGTFSEKFIEHARITVGLMKGTVYSHYYDLESIGHIENYENLD